MLCKVKLVKKNIFSIYLINELPIGNRSNFYFTAFLLKMNWYNMFIIKFKYLNILISMLKINQVINFF